MLAQGLVQPFGATDAWRLRACAVIQIIVDQRFQVGADETDNPAGLQDSTAFVQQANTLVTPESLQKMSTVDSWHRALFPRQSLARRPLQIGPCGLHINIDKALARMIGAT
ncbi:hypothetical protein BR1R5_28830 [Pseudomonas sp. BR1R-5]|nr:hypothetical protein BR1R5_28830 [Pseudomonas sp. BR1R-5]